MSTRDIVSFAAPKYVRTLSGWLDPMAQKGMVTTPHYLASQAGISVLKNGGNAIDAAIAAASTLSVVNPHMAALGGDNYWLIFNATTREVRGLNASRRAGKRAKTGLSVAQQLSRL